MQPKFLACSLALLSCVSAATEAQDSRPSTRPSSPEVPGGMAEAFAMLDALGTPDTTACSFVEVVRSQRERFDPKSAFGFLMDETGGTFTVWLIDLEVKQFRQDRGASYAHADLAAHAKHVMDSAVNNDHLVDWNPLGVRSYLISLARELSRRGQDDLARTCCSTASSLRPSRGGGRLGDGTLRGTIKEEVETAWIWRAMLACGEADMDRSDLLDGFRRYLKSFPDGRFVKEAQDMAQELERMVQEDIRHRQENRAIETMTDAEKIEDLVYQLREQNGHQLMVPGHASAMASRRSGNAAWQLAAIGYAAVPRLIAAIDDRRPTRTVGCWRDFVFSHYVLRIGDCAVEILEQIAGRQFFASSGSFSYMLKDGMEKRVRAEVMKWWDQVRPKAAETQPAETRPAPR
jgi:hypothetical protein